MNNPHTGLAGRWAGILEAKGIKAEVLDGKQHPCPVCGGTDRFRFDDKDEGRWYCNHCGAGDGFSLLMAKFGYTFKDALIEVDALAGRVKVRERTRSQSDHAKRVAMNRVWAEATPQCAALSAYLAQRRIPEALHANPAVRWHKGLYCSAKDATAPAVLIKCYRWGINGQPEPVTIQRHWPSLNTKMMMPSPVKQDGIFCPLGGRPDGVLGVAEGYITALSVRTAWAECPVWACMTADQMARFTPPPDIHTLVIFGDNDASFTGQAVAYTLARRLRVSHPQLKLEVKIAYAGERTDIDYNDLLQETANAT